MHFLILSLLGVALLFGVLTLLGLYEPSLGLARSRGEVVRRNGTIALLVYVLMAIALSSADINRRGYDRHLNASGARLQPAAAPAHPHG